MEELVEKVLQNNYMKNGTKKFIKINIRKNIKPKSCLIPH